MKKILVAVAAFALLGVLVPQAEAGRRHYRHNRSHYVSSHCGPYRVVHHNRYRRAYYRPYYSSYYDPYYSSYYFPAPVIRFSFGGGFHHRHH
jgi:hypothetical protein